MFLGVTSRGGSPLKSATKIIKMQIHSQGVSVNLTHPLLELGLSKDSINKISRIVYARNNYYD